MFLHVRAITVVQYYAFKNSVVLEFLFPCLKEHSFNSFIDIKLYFYFALYSVPCIMVYFLFAFLARLLVGGSWLGAGWLLKVESTNLN